MQKKKNLRPAKKRAAPQEEDRGGGFLRERAVPLQCASVHCRLAEVASPVFEERLWPTLRSTGVRFRSNMCRFRITFVILFVGDVDFVLLCVASNLLRVRVGNVLP